VRKGERGEPGQDEEEATGDVESRRCGFEGEGDRGETGAGWGNENEKG
jgi:hypothetical protein